MKGADKLVEKLASPRGYTNFAKRYLFDGARKGGESHPIT